MKGYCNMVFKKSFSLSGYSLLAAGNIGQLVTTAFVWIKHQTVRAVLKIKSSNKQFACPLLISGLNASFGIYSVQI